MDLSLSSSLKQEQTLSPQMLQALALLPMPIMELKTFIQAEIESNPALELPESDFESNDSEDDTYEEEDSYDEESDNRKQQAIENSEIVGESLSEHLLVQLGLAEISEKEYRIGEMLIGNLDANGFFIVTLDKLFENEKYTEKEIKGTVELVQTFDPFGVCVSDFRQSLVLQAKCSGMGKSDLEIFEKMVNGQLEKIKAGKNKDVAQALHISEEDLETFVQIMKGFTPFPGRNFDTDGDNFVIPEFSVHIRDGQPVVEMNRAGMPDIVLSNEFTQLGKNLTGPEAKQTSDYIRSSVSRAKSLISQVEMRYKTLSNCAEALVVKQRDFFFNGPMFLKPMTLKDLAEEIGVHETTMSRLAQSKWVDTDWGLFQLKSFFTQGVKAADNEGESVSRNVVKGHIEEILKENPKLSDQKISDRLAELGIKCARRTVSKYRAELNIDSSYSRI